MPKKVYSNFGSGLSYSDRNEPESTYWEGREIDIHRDPGYLTTGWSLAVVTKSDDGTPIINDLIIDICVDHTTDDTYFLGATDRIYHMSATVAETWDADFDGAAHYYKAITGATRGESLFIYPTKIGAAAAANKLFYIFQDDFGMYDLSSTFDDDWGSTVPAGAGALQDAPHPTIEWQTYRWIGNGRYVAKFDGQTGDNGTIELTKLDLGQGWEITDMFPTQNYIGIAAWRKQATSSIYRTECRIFFWDGTSANHNYSVPISDNKILSALNHDGIIYLWTYGTEGAVNFSYLDKLGAKKIRLIKTPIAGTLTNFTDIKRNARDIFENRTIFGSQYLVFSYGKEVDTQQSALSVPWGYSTASGANVGAVKTVLNNKVFISHYDGTIYYLLKATTGNSTRATWRGNYTDFGQKVKINYVKVYFKALASGDAVTPTLDVDYGTSVALMSPAGDKTIAYATNGAITSKKFIPDSANFRCHAFRPVLSTWTGATTISKIVVDYDFVEDV